jgi:formyltetrahydrofolate deformylase
MMKTAKLLLHCPDRPGILAEVTDFITVNKGNIIYLNQYIDHVEDIFFMRIEWELQDFLILQEKTDRAVQKHIEHKVLAYKNRTVIFN